MEERRTEACQFEKIIGVSDVSGGLLSLSAFGPLFGYQEPSFLPMFVSGLLFHSRLHRYCPLHDVACNYCNDDYPSNSAVVAFFLPLRTLHQEVCFREGEGYVQTQVNSSTCPWYCWLRVGCKGTDERG